jgi:hypothetical protein
LPVYDGQMPKPAGAELIREYPERRAEEVVDRALAWLNAQSGKPYLRWVHVFDPYLPYEPPAPFDRTCKGREYDGEGNALVAVMADHGVSAMQ